jgi:hypothetical protein
LKKATIIFSFFLISVFSIGGYLVHRLYLHNYKKEFKAYVSRIKESTSFTTIDINPSELYVNSKRIAWEDENKEVVYKGILHDVVSIKGKGLSVELTLISDHEEMKLKKDFAGLYDVTTSGSSKKPFELLKNLLSLKYLVQGTGFKLYNAILVQDVSFPKPGFLLICRAILPDAPPPDCSL